MKKIKKTFLVLGIITILAGGVFPANAKPVSSFDNPANLKLATVLQTDTRQINTENPIPLPYPVSPPLPPPNPPLPSPKEPIQFNELIIKSISSPLPPSKIIAVKSTDRDRKCIKYPSVESEKGITIICPSIPIQSSDESGSTLKEETINSTLSPAYTIEVDRSTVILLKDRRRGNLKYFEPGDLVNVFGFYDPKTNTIEALIIRNLSKPEEGKFIQLNNVEIVDIKTIIVDKTIGPEYKNPELITQLTVVQKPNNQCYDYGKTGNMKRPVPCPLSPSAVDELKRIEGIKKTFGEEVKPIVIPLPVSIFTVYIDSTTKIIDRLRRPLNINALEVGDKINVYGFTRSKGEIDAKIIRDLNKPEIISKPPQIEKIIISKPPQTEKIKGTIVKINADGSFQIKTTSGQILDVRNPFLQGRDLIIFGKIDSQKNSIDEISAIEFGTRPITKVTVGTRPITRPITKVTEGKFDYNNDGQLNAEDIKYLTDVASGSKKCPERRVCDLNKDRKSDIFDINILTDFTLGKYDYNGDFLTNSEDIQIFNDIITGSRKCPTDKTCDINGDKKVNIFDSLLLRDMVSSNSKQ